MLKCTVEVTSSFSYTSACRTQNEFSEMVRVNHNNFIHLSGLSCMHITATWQ